MTPRARVLAALRRERVYPVPVGAVTQSANRAQMEALSIRWPAAHFDPELMAGLAAGARTILGFDMVRVPFDQTIEAELLGAQVHFGDELTNCSVRSHPLSLGQPVPGLPDLGAGRAKTVVEAIAKLSGGDAAVIGGIVGPFTLVCQLIGISEALMSAVRRPDVLRPYLDFAIELGTCYARRQIEAGADAICIEDMSASLDLTSPGIYRNLILPAHQRLIAEIDVPVILHICGSNTRILDLLSATGAAALSLEAKTDLSQVGSTCAVIGGVAPVEVLLHGTLEDVRRASLECLAAGVHILAPGCGIPPGAPTENLLEMARVAREWQP
jgi:[methyl-Co(III) methanol-specific corrinoid protein]:coenzyme M methyltransferase